MAGDVSKDFGPRTFINAVRDVSQLFLDSCFAMLKTNDTMKVIQEADMIVTISVMPCGHYIADLYDKPTILLHPASYSFIASYTGVPDLASFVPMVTGPFTDEMSFIERVQNFLTYRIRDIIVKVFLTYWFRDLQSAYNWKSKDSFTELFGKTEMVIVTMDFAYQYVSPIMPSEYFAL